MDTNTTQRSGPTVPVKTIIVYIRHKKRQSRPCYGWVQELNSGNWQTCEFNLAESQHINSASYWVLRAHLPLSSNSALKKAPGGNDKHILPLNSDWYSKLTNNLRNSVEGKCYKIDISSMSSN